MRVFFSNSWERLRASFWLVPTLLALGAIALSAFTLHVDTQINPQWARATGWIWGGGPEGARSVLATVASSTITVAGVVFSITIVTLTLTSSQFGPRLLRSFMNDRGTQLVLGVFVATFLYCLLVLRAIRGTDELTIVPFLSVTCGVVFAVTSVGFLIYFIHHISTSIIAENVIARVARDLRANIDRLYPKELSRKTAADAPAPPGTRDQFDHDDAEPIVSNTSGFIQAIATEELIQLARERGLVFRLARRPGDFVAEGAVLAEAAPRAKIHSDLASKVLKQVYFGRDRTPTQDIEYSIDQLVEVAVRALSPGVNDPFTALTCLEWLGAALIRIAQREIPPRGHEDAEGRLRLITVATDFDGIAAAALNQLRQFGCSSVALVIRLLDVLARVAPHLLRHGDQEALRRHARAVRDDGVAAAGNAHDKHDIESAFRSAQVALGRSL